MPLIDQCQECSCLNEQKMSGTQQASNTVDGPEPDLRTLNEAQQVNPLDIPPFWHIGTHARDEPEQVHQQPHHRTVFIGGGLTNRMISQEDCIIETTEQKQTQDTQVKKPTSKQA